jgi:superfamily II helicase
MSDHQTSYTINSMLGRLYLKNKAFQSLSFEQQQSIVLDIITESYNSDVNLGEILSNECFLEEKDCTEKRTLSTIFKICSYCGQAKERVEDDREKYSRQGFCYDCASEVLLEDEFSAMFSKKETQN